MPNYIKTIRREKPLINRTEFFTPRRAVPPYACSIKIIRDILANAKCNFPVISIFIRSIPFNNDIDVIDRCFSRSGSIIVLNLNLKGIDFIGRINGTCNVP